MKNFIKTGIKILINTIKIFILYMLQKCKIRDIKSLYKRVSILRFHILLNIYKI